VATRQRVLFELSQAIGISTGRIAVAALNNLRNSTRRDTAYHASRWVGSVGSRPAAVDTPPTRTGRAQALSFAQQAASIAALSSYRLGQGNVFIGNDGNYIEELDREDQFVNTSIERAVRDISLAGTGLRR
jgi:hypothetical protein